MPKVEVLYDGRKLPVVGLEIVRQARSKSLNFLDYSSFVELFKKDDAILAKFKGPDFNNPFIFCFDKLYPTPFLNNNKDLCVEYFQWSFSGNCWYPSYWRIRDSWNVVVATIFK